MIPFVTEEIYRYIPGAEGLLAAGGVPSADAVGTSAPRRASARVIEAVQALRGWRDFAGVQGRGAPSRPAWPPRVTRRPASTWRGSRGWRSTRMGPSRWRPCRFPAGRSRSCPARTSTSEGAERRLAAQRAKLEAEIERAERKLAQRGVRRQGAARGRPGRARQAGAAARAELDGAVRAEEAERYVLSPRAVRDAVRAGPHAAADDRARATRSCSFESIHVVGTNGKSSTVRMTAAILARHGLRTGAYLSPHLVSFAERIRVDDEDLSRRSSPPRSSARRTPPSSSTARSSATTA